MTRVCVVWAGRQCRQRTTWVRCRLSCHQVWHVERSINPLHLCPPLFQEPISTGLASVGLERNLTTSSLTVTARWPSPEDVDTLKWAAESLNVSVLLCRSSRCTTRLDATWTWTRARSPSLKTVLLGSKWQMIVFKDQWHLHKCFSPPGNNLGVAFDIPQHLKNQAFFASCVLKVSLSITWEPVRKGGPGAAACVFQFFFVPRMRRPERRAEV